MHNLVEETSECSAPVSIAPLRNASPNSPRGFAKLHSLHFLLALLSLAACSISDPKRQLSAHVAAAFNSADARTLAPLICKPNGPHYSVDDAGLLLRRESAGMVAIVEFLRSESLEEDPDVNVLVVKTSAQFGGLQTTYLVSVPCSGGQAVLATETHNFVSGLYPIADAAERASLLAQVSRFYSTNRLSTTKAESLSRMAFVMRPHDPEVLRSLAWAQFVGGDPAAAYSVLERLADSKGGVPQQFNKDWNEIRSALTDIDVEIRSVDYPRETRTHSARLSVATTQPAFFALSGGSFKSDAPTTRWDIDVPLSVGANSITFHLRRFRYAGRTVTASINIAFKKYVANADGTVTDLTTNLMWGRDFIECRTRYGSYRDILNVIANLRLGGYDDWRLPTRKELLSIVSGHEMVDTKDHQFFPYQGRGGAHRLRLHNGKEVGLLATSEVIDDATYWVYSFPDGKLNYHYFGYGCWGLPVRVANQ